MDEVGDEHIYGDYDVGEDDNDEDTSDGEGMSGEFNNAMVISK